MPLPQQPPSQTQDTAGAIDQKRRETALADGDLKTYAGKTITWENCQTFLVRYLKSLCFLVLLLTIGNYGLFQTKLATANVFPHDRNLSPFTNTVPAFNNVVIDLITLNVLNLETQHHTVITQKALFNPLAFLESFENSFFAGLRANSAIQRGGWFANGALFYSKVSESMLLHNFIVHSLFFKTIADLPEWLTLVGYGTFGVFHMLLLYLYNLVLSLVFHVAHIPQLFRCPSSDDPGLWQKETDTSFFSSPLRIFAFCFFWLPLGFATSFIMPGVMTLYSLLVSFSPRYVSVNTQSPSETKRLVDFLLDGLSFRRGLFMTLATLSLASVSSDVFGNIALPVSALIAGVGYGFGIYDHTIKNEKTLGDCFSIDLGNPKNTVSSLDVSNPSFRHILPQIQESFETSTNTLEQFFRLFQPIHKANPGLVRR